MSRAAQKNQKKSSKKVSGVDPFNAADFARAAALEDAKNVKFVGTQISVESDDEHVVTYLFEAFLPGYVGWRWAVTVAKVDEKSSPTICDVVLLPGADAGPARVAQDEVRSEERRVGKECHLTCRSRWSPYH